MLDVGSTIVVVGAGSAGMAPSAAASTVVVGPGETVGPRRGTGAVVVARRGRPPTAAGDGGEVGRGTVGGGAVAGGAVTSGVVVGDVDGVVSGGTVDGSDGGVTCATAAMGPGAVSIVAPATVAASTRAPWSRRRTGVFRRRAPALPAARRA